MKTMIPNPLLTQAQKMRRDIVTLSQTYNHHHIAPALSMVEILVFLYDVFMDHDDQFLLSKGHGSLALYAVLRERGFDPHIAAHPERDEAQGIQCTSGSLGHGIGIAAGKALARKIKKYPGTIFVMVGDGECQEGAVWETLTLAMKYHLDNLVIIVDHNKLQALDLIDSIHGEPNLRRKAEAFGAFVLETDGHDFDALANVFQQINNSTDKPIVILAHTIKGKGISFMENDPKWHVRGLTEEEQEQAMQELR